MESAAFKSGTFDHILNCATVHPCSEQEIKRDEQLDLDLKCCACSSCMILRHLRDVAVPHHHLQTRQGKRDEKANKKIFAFRTTQKCSEVVSFLEYFSPFQTPDEFVPYFSKKKKMQQEISLF